MLRHYMMGALLLTLAGSSFALFDGMHGRSCNKHTKPCPTTCATGYTGTPVCTKGTCTGCTATPAPASTSTKK